MIGLRNENRFNILPHLSKRQLKNKFKCCFLFISVEIEEEEETKGKVEKEDEIRRNKNITDKYNAISVSSTLY